MIHNSVKSSLGGFRLIELMVAIAFVCIFIPAVYSILLSVQRNSTSNEVTARVMQTLRNSIGIVESDIRMAGLDRFGTAAAGIEDATLTNLRFTADRNMDGKIDTAVLLGSLEEQDLERITYFYDAPNNQLRQCLSEGTTNAWDTVAENVEGFWFKYFDADNNEFIDLMAMNKSLVRSIEVSMTVSQPAGIADPISRTITKRIVCRNLAMK